jgi:hypothetical protein
MKTWMAKHKWLVGGVTFIDEVLKLASGKVQRKVMREWAKRDAAMLETSGFKASLRGCIRYYDPVQILVMIDSKNTAQLRKLLG